MSWMSLQRSRRPLIRKEHTGLKVSSLDIAQIKEKCGIKERENYNKPKSDSLKKLICLAEKEEAIKDAFKYFKMI